MGDEPLSTLRMIAIRSQVALTEALSAIRAHQAGQQTLADRRASKAATLALADPAADWTADERAQIIAIFGHDVPDTALRKETIRFLATKEEKRQVAAAAKAVRLSQSDYIRQHLGLDLTGE